MDLSILDVQQIFGRAGRPQFDSFGEAHLITSHASLQRYVNLLVHQSPIESNFIKQLADHLNAEVVGGTVCNINEASQWLQYTYLYVRMLKNPMAYGIDSAVLDSDPALKQKTTELVSNAAKLLDERRMLRYDPKSGNLAVTDHGRVASHFYIQNESVAAFNELLARIPHATDADLIHVICNACEFVNVKVRQEELKEIDQLLVSSCPLGVTATPDTSPGKSNILLQSFINGTRITSFTLISDTNYIASNAGRVARALFEMCLRRGNAGHANKFLKIAKTVDKKGEGDRGAKDGRLERSDSSIPHTTITNHPSRARFASHSLVVPLPSPSVCRGSSPQYFPRPRESRLFFLRIHHRPSRHD